ncbi:Hypothetical protein PHPALM_843 [Phytophthora palmivora]|uniref:PB1 domain-containing protein n=1 Tax=Phytophthora palmivora TaxID=4796 RepID=A0A2P4YTY4_9STRA|nr:Hypothetical protein PHPALM_843 [Phytophthora palmivora]
MVRTLEIKTNYAELQQSLSLTNDNGETLTMNQLQTTAASLLPNQEFLLRYTDSDRDHVTITSDADVKEIENTQRTATVIQTQLRGLVTAMSKLTAKPESNPTPTSAMNLLAASLEAMDVAQDAKELATVKKEMLLVLQDETFRKMVEELSATEEFKELADALVTAIYQEDAQVIEDTATAHFDELLTFAQRIIASCPSLKHVVVNVTKSLLTGLVRHNDG